MPKFEYSNRTTLVEFEKRCLPADAKRNIIQTTAKHDMAKWEIRYFPHLHVNFILMRFNVFSAIHHSFEPFPTIRTHERTRITMSQAMSFQRTARRERLRALIAPIHANSCIEKYIDLDSICIGILITENVT